MSIEARHVLGKSCRDGLEHQHHHFVHLFQDDQHDGNRQQEEYAAGEGVDDELAHWTHDVLRVDAAITADVRRGVNACACITAGYRI